MKKIFNKQFLTVAILCVLSQIMILSALANVNVGITPEQQEKTNWCWAATSVVVAKYYGKTTIYLSQGGILVPVTQSNHALKTQGSTNNNTRNITDIQSDFLNCYNISSSYTANSLSTGDTTSQLYSNTPVYIRQQWAGGTNGHAVLITGYITAAAQFRVMDPLTGGHLYHTYSTLTSAYPDPLSNVTGTWTHTIYNFAA